MKFCDVLNQVIENLDCTAKQVSQLSSISPSTLSRYRNGDRVPEINSDVYLSLCHALSLISKDKGKEYTLESIQQLFLQCDDFITFSKDIFASHLNEMIETLNINVSKLCNHINYDVSTLYRFRNKLRTPGDLLGFCKLFAGYIVEEYDTSSDLETLASLMQCDKEKLLEKDSCIQAICDYLLQDEEIKDDSILSLLTKLNDFDLNEYIRAIHFDELKVPSMPIQFSKKKDYFGIEGMKESELNFLKTTVLSKSKEDVIMFSDMPIEQLAKDEDFAKKWMFGLAMLLKKGLHLYQIHHLDRSFSEMLLGLESWIPIYMTGQISPYYFKNKTDSSFLHFLKVSGVAALSGEAIVDDLEGVKMSFTSNKNDLEYYQRRAKAMLAKATPLMEIYDSSKTKQLIRFLEKESEVKGNRRNIYSMPPIYTLSYQTLKDILDRNEIEDNIQDKIIHFYQKQAERKERILAHSTIEDEITILDEVEFNAYPLFLPYIQTFCDKQIRYTYQDYLKHIEDTKTFESLHEHYIFTPSTKAAFRNLQISIKTKKWVLISKNKAPAIHFLIMHPKLSNAIENFNPPIVDK